MSIAVKQYEPSLEALAGLDSQAGLRNTAYKDRPEESTWSETILKRKIINIDV